MGLDWCRALEEMFLANGARIGYWRGSIEGMIEDLQVLAIFIASPLFPQADLSPGGTSTLVPCQGCWQLLSAAAVAPYSGLGRPSTPMAVPIVNLPL